jgi:hypothetical protein
MKDFKRLYPLFSLCGLNCGLCPMHLDNYCPGCGGGAGKINHVQLQGAASSVVELNTAICVTSILVKNMII